MAFAAFDNKIGPVERRGFPRHRIRGFFQMVSGALAAAERVETLNGMTDAELEAAGLTRRDIGPEGLRVLKTSLNPHPGMC